MKIILATDDALPVVDTIERALRERGHEVTRLPQGVWGPVSAEAARRVAAREFTQGIVMCWTGTGASIAANKVAGIRCALCVDAVTATGARKWNDANVLALSLRLLSDAVAVEILEAWLTTDYGGTEDESLAALV